VIVTTRATRWITTAALIALAVGLAVGVTASGPAWGAGLASTEWPMFHRDAEHTGSSLLPGPTSARIRWWQGGAAFADESGHRPHGPQGAIWSSAATSEVTPELGGAKKVWYFHNSSWTGRGAAPGPPLVLRSEYPEAASTNVPLTGGQTLFETSAAMNLAAGSASRFRNRDPYSNLSWVQAGVSFLLKQRVPAGTWLFSLWVTDVVPTVPGVPVQAQFTVYSFTEGLPDTTRVALPGLDAISVPLPDTAPGASSLVTYAQPVAAPIYLELTQGVSIGVTVSGGTATLKVGDTSPSRVETSIEVPAIYAGADDGALYAFDAATGNVLWSFRVPNTWFRSSPAVGDDGSIYIGSYEGAQRDQGDLYAFRPDGTLKWLYPALDEEPLDAISASPVIGGDDVVYIATHAGEVHAVDAADGQARWVRAIEEEGIADELRSSPALSSSGTLYIGSMNGRLYALDSGSGEIMWRYPASGQTALGALESSPALDSDLVRLYFVNEVATGDPSRLHLGTGAQGDPGDEPAGEIAQSFGATGQAKFAQEFRTHARQSEPAMPSVLPGGSYTVDFWARAALESPTTEQAWMRFSVFHCTAADPVGTQIFSFPEQDIQSSTAPVRYQAQATLASAVALQPTDYLRVEVWSRVALESGHSATVRFAFDGEFVSHFEVPLEAERIYIGSDDGNIYCLQSTVTEPNVVEPQLEWSYATGDAVTATPAIGPDRTVYVGSLDHKLYALDPDGTLASGAWPFQAAGEIQSSAAVTASDPARIYFATSVVAQVGSNLAAGRVYCLERNAGVVWTDPIDFGAGFDPRGGDPTAFTASPAPWLVESVRGSFIGPEQFRFTGVSRVVDPVVYLGGHDGVMYAFGTVLDNIAPPPVMPGQVPAQSVLRLTKQADKAVADVGEEITFTLRYRNESSPLAAPVSGAQIWDPLPEARNYLGVIRPAAVAITTYSPGGVESAGGMIWSVGDIWPQRSGQVWFKVQVMEDLAETPSTPQVSVSRTDPVTAVPPPGEDDFAWGDTLYLDLTGRGRPGKIINSPATSQAGIYVGANPLAYAAPVEVAAGWGTRYRLAFTYGPENNDPASLAKNQYVDLNHNGLWDVGEPQLSYATEIILSATGTRTGRSEEAYEDPMVLAANETVFKVVLLPRGYAGGLGARSVTEAPNRAWTPYFWRVAVQQNRGGAPGREVWGPAWEPQRTQTYDIMVHNPLAAPASYDLAGGIAVNPGTRTNRTSFTVTNVSGFSLVGSGRTPQPNVVRLGFGDLGQVGAAYPSYDFRLENYLPAHRLVTGLAHLGLPAGGSGSLALWGDIPAYLSPGAYRSPRTGNPLSDAVTAGIVIYVDINGNRMWDLGEARFEDEAGGSFNPFTVTAWIAPQPSLRFAGESVDYAKASPGTTAAQPTTALVNLGNVGLTAVQLNPLQGGLLSLARAERTDTGLTDWRETHPLPVDLSAVSQPVAKTPVGWLRPYQQSLSLPQPDVSWSQPSGAYSAAPDVVSAAEGLTAPGSPFTMRVAERRLTGYDWSTGQPVLGANLDPWATWLGNDTLLLLWSSQRKSDGSDPTPANPPTQVEPYQDANGNRQWDAGEWYDDRNGNGTWDRADPYLLRYRSFDRTTEPGAWTAAQNYPAAGDPMDLPAPAPPAWYDWLTKEHMTPGFGVDADGTQWLFWGGSALRANSTGGHSYDNRLLWSDSSAIYDSPNVSGGGTASDMFRLHPRPVFWDDGANEYNCVVFSEHSASQAWRLSALYRSRPLGNPAWGAWAGPVTLDTTGDITAAREPSAFIYGGYLWVVFSGASQTYGNYDIYCARYSPAPPFTPVAFAGGLQLLRLTTHPANESNPAAFIETYRYLDASNQPRPSVAAGDPADYDPRLWVFWVQEGIGGGGGEIMYVTLRGLQTNPLQLTPERAPRQVSVDHAANDFGLCAVKDRRYAQVWLFWSSTRGAPTAGAAGAAANSDIYCQAFNPELP